MMRTRDLVASLISSLLIALMLQMVQLPDLLAAARPIWPALVLAYWALREPRLSMLLPAFMLGVIQDVIFGTVLGQHALSLLVVVYLVERLRSILILFPLWQATLVLLPLWALYSFLMFWIDGMTHHQADAWLRWLPVLSTTLFWPLLYSSMELLRRPPQEEP
ncbi:rod shape-determining protein MreD [Sinimarinibacterium sp. NLF-5-8]|uniref:rod shape-determining protein MreD n=1 Tax=Sinimarinibacterium sp. NLF-5-8 TaxID=2698684 RepID=UPI00137BEDFF|nr:rod shape-determining protein MreD [Sinimarinibacterium sp. NLF-5-8]QHS10517.1 rod shape-determining protein MreD [Sinimarinibacterium sp. NLF-5-8]